MSARSSSSAVSVALDRTLLELPFCTTLTFCSGQNQVQNRTMASRVTFLKNKGMADHDVEAAFTQTGALEVRLALLGVP